MLNFIKNVTFLVAVLVVIVANLYGWWYVTFIAGMVIGVLPSRLWRTLWTSAVCGVAGWGIALCIEFSFHSLRPASAVLSATMGFGTSGWLIPIVITFVSGLLLSLSGTWLSRSVKTLMHPTPHSVQ